LFNGAAEPHHQTIGLLGRSLKQQQVTAIFYQTNHKNKFESLAKPSFQIYSWFGFWRKAL